MHWLSIVLPTLSPKVAIFGQCLWHACPWPRHPALTNDYADICCATAPLPTNQQGIGHICLPRCYISREEGWKTGLIARVNFHLLLFDSPWETKKSRPSLLTMVPACAKPDLRVMTRLVLSSPPSLDDPVIRFVTPSKVATSAAM